MIFSYYKILRKLYKKDNLASKVLLKILNKPYELILKLVYGAHVPYNSDIDCTTKFPHSFYGIFISGNAIVEKNCIIFHHVTIGAGFPKTDKAPIVKENTFIGANSSIFGNIIIGKNVNIGGGTVLAKNIPDDCTVVSSANRIVLHEK